MASVVASGAGLVNISYESFPLVYDRRFTDILRICSRRRATSQPDKQIANHIIAAA